MLTEYLSYYLIFIIVASILITLIVLRLKFFAPRYLVPIIAAIILLPALIVYLYFTYFTSIPEVVVPNLTGMRLEEAFVKLESLKLKGREAGQVFDMKYAEGMVVSQRPESGRRVKVGRSVNLLTSSGKRRVMVPNLLGRPAVQAGAVLSAKGLILGMTSEEYVPELDAGIILTQSPLPGEEIDAGSYVSITVSTTFEPEVVVEEGAGEGEKKEEAPTEKSGQGGFWPW
ncbi:MAG: PASTA domain-containing protein [Candidatus Margulisiibacteriota bacterium]